MAPPNSAHRCWPFQLRQYLLQILVHWAFGLYASIVRYMGLTLIAVGLKSTFVVTAIVINNGHRDFVYVSRNRSLKLRYICRLFAKEMVYRNFPGYSPEQLLERMIELSLYEENLK